MTRIIRTTKEFFRVIAREEFDKHLIVLATWSTLIVSMILLPKERNFLRIIPIFLLTLYIAIKLVQAIKLTRSIYPHVVIPFFVCLAQTKDWFSNAVRLQEEALSSLGYQWVSIQKIFRVHRNDWTFFEEGHLGLLSSDWSVMVKRISIQFWQLSKRVDRQPIYHFFFAVPSTVAVGMGASFGRRIPFAIYQHVGSAKNPYEIVARTDTFSSIDSWHMQNQRVLNYELIEYNSLSIPSKISGKSVIIALNFSGHKLPSDYIACEELGVVEVKLKNSCGHIPFSMDWVLLSREISSVILGYLDSHAFVHLYPGLPATLGFLIGSIIGSHDHVIVYHYNKKDHAYALAFNLGEFS